MQKLERRNTYTPTDAPQVCSNCDLVLNSNERDSVQGLKTLSNNSKVDLRSGMSEQDLRVLVLNMHRKRVGVKPLFFRWSEKYRR